MRKEILLIALPSCSLLPTAPTAPTVPAAKSPNTSTALVDAAPAAIDAATNFLEVLIWTGLAASVIFPQVRMALAAMLVAFYNRIESWFKPKKQP
jgi:hypothetical protein